MDCHVERSPRAARHVARDRQLARPRGVPRGGPPRHVDLTQAEIRLILLRQRASEARRDETRRDRAPMAMAMAPASSFSLCCRLPHPRPASAPWILSPRLPCLLLPHESAIKNQKKISSPTTLVPPSFCLPSTAVPEPTPVTSDFFEFICEGPLLSKVGLDPDSVTSNIEEWIELGLRLSRQLGFNSLFLTLSERIRVYHYYIPVYMWCKKQLSRHRDQFEGNDDIPALVVSTFLVHARVPDAREKEPPSQIIS